jgi:hypothetical protein
MGTTTLTGSDKGVVGARLKLEDRTAAGLPAVSALRSIRHDLATIAGACRSYQHGPGFYRDLGDLFDVMADLLDDLPDDPALSQSVTGRPRGGVGWVGLLPTPFCPARRSEGGMESRTDAIEPAS